jgi:hypothetical protein|tara:strand:- start:469 stop:690 length:222 start_codon:yes stop_codon:yes gene_type:complete
MTLKLLKGFFYDEDGYFTQWYEGYGDLTNLEELLEHKYPAIGFVETKSVNATAFKYDTTLKKVIPIIITGSAS